MKTNTYMIVFDKNIDYLNYLYGAKDEFPIGFVVVSGNTKRIREHRKIYFKSPNPIYAYVRCLELKIDEMEKNGSNDQMVELYEERINAFNIILEKYPEHII